MPIRAFSSPLDDANQLVAWLEGPAVREALASARAVLLQLHDDAPDARRAQALAAAARQRLPGALILGMSSEGGIAAGLPVRDRCVASLLCFGQSQLACRVVEVAPRHEVAAADELLAALAEAPGAGVATGSVHPPAALRGLMLLSPAGLVDGGAFVEAVQAGLDADAFGDRSAGDAPVVLFGGVAALRRPADTLRAAGLPRAWLLAEDRLHTGPCVVAVGFYGAALQLQQQLLFDWKPIGPRVRLTEVVAGCEVRRIDEAPAADVYQRLLRIGAQNDEIYLLEFPLVVQRGKVAVARNPVSLAGDGTVSFVASLRQGEVARLAYLDMDAALATVAQARAALASFQPQALLMHSCVCRLQTLQQEIEFETRPFQALADAAGWYTHGEFGQQGQAAHLFNSTQSVVGLREAVPDDGNPAAPLQPEGVVPAPQADAVRFRHAVITSRLLDAIGRLSDELDAANARLRHLAEHDGLTGARNRRALDSQLPAEVARAARHGRPLALLMLDLDHFKQFNDRHGHAAGDRALQRFVEVVKSCGLRASDALYRYGGEEFVLLLPESDAPAGCQVAARVRDAVRLIDLDLPDRAAPALSCSVGAAAWAPGSRAATARPAASGPEMAATDTAATVAALLRAADAALYEAKRSGRDRCCIAPPLA